MSTSYLKRRPEMTREALPKCHDGEGSLDWTSVLGGDDVRGRIMNFFHDDIMPPGASVGIHKHTDDEEYYYILTGYGVMTLDGVEYDIGSGDIAGVFPGGAHGLKNTGTEDIRFIVVSVKQ